MFARFLGSAVLVASIGSLVHTRDGIAQSTDLAISIAPDSLVIGPGGTDKAFLVLRNSSTSPLKQLRLTSLAAGGVSVRFADTLFASVAPGAAVVTTLVVARDSAGARPGSVVIRADYRKGSPGIPGVVVSRVKLAGEPFETVEQVAKVELSATATTLTEREPTTAYVVVTNKTDLPLSVRRIAASGALIAELDTAVARSIPPHGVRAFPIDLRLDRDRRIQPGKRTVLFNVELAWSSTTGPRTGNAMLLHDVDLGVFGESVVLKVLSVPSFLVLPGFLMLVTFGLIWKYRDFLRGAKGSAFGLTPASADFWVIAITLSGLMAVVSGGAYLSGYRTTDLVTVWLASVLLGAAAGLLWFSWKYLWTTPSAKDSQATILRKLGRQGMGIECELVALENGDKRYLLQPLPEAGDVWIGPTIAITWTKQATGDDRNQYSALREARKARPVADFLDAARKRGAVSVEWEPAAERPTTAPVAKVTRSGSGLVVEAS